ncbi:hypothetical protein [Streptomyces aureus]|uniref:hypothetical protein n=1 Tax=Streptomyces aureus TaxID=193461 RepID=UPI0006E1AFF6|nr:hypothetical protein [Streptomyces aureus]
MEAYVDGGGYGMRAMSAEAVRYNTESMTEFKKGIDGLIETLTSSEADKSKMKSDPVVRGQFGGGGGAWAEASGVYDSYNNVLRQLTELSGLLKDCLEGVGIAVVASKDGFEQMDDDVKRKMINIHDRTWVAKDKADKEAGRGGSESQGSQNTESDSPFK